MIAGARFSLLAKSNLHFNKSNFNLHKSFRLVTEEDLIAKQLIVAEGKVFLAFKQ